MTAADMAAAIFMFRIVLSLHKRSESSGDSGKSMHGEPKMPCSFRGKGKMPAPSIEKEKVKISRMGVMLSPLRLAILQRPTTKRILRTDITTSEKVKIYCVFVPMVPNSLTILVRWL